MDIDDLPAELAHPGAVKPAPLRTAALAARSLNARVPLAAIVSGTPLAELLAAARDGRPLPDPAHVGALGELAMVLAAQDLLPSDTADAYALLEAALATYGPQRIRTAHRALHAQLAFHLGHHTRLRKLRRAYGWVPGTVRLDLRNPLFGGDPAAWLKHFRLLLPSPLTGPQLTLADGDAPALDRLRATADPVTAPERITSIVTTFKPDEGLVTAVRSLVAQTWQNHEILVVDDGSPAEYDAVLRRCTDLDPRVRLLKLAVNGGTYLARNAAFDAATGDFLTYQDSDDWSHPMRLEFQVAPLLADPALFSTTSNGMRVTQDLVVTRPGFLSHRSYNLSSVLFRRETALRKVGYLDTVRKGADAEYAERARAVFGRGAVQHLSGAPYALIRLSSGSLSAADFRMGWTHAARRAYLSAFRAWHRDVAARTADPRRPRDPAAPRVFPAPQRLRGGPAPAAPHYDMILAQDWTPATMDASAPGRIRALLDRGLRVALLQLDELRHLTDGPRALDDRVQRLINDGTVDQVLLDSPATAGLLLVSSPSVLPFAPSEPGALRPDRVVVAGPARPASAAAAVRLFGTEPTFDGPASSVDLAAPGRPAPGPWPVAGWRAGPAPVTELFDGADTLDVRVLGGTELPAHVLGYDPDDLHPRDFLHQLDFYLHLDGHPHAVAEAMAAGCVPVLPPALAAVYGDAALYADRDGITATIRSCRGDTFLAQRARASAYVTDHLDHETFAHAVATAVQERTG